MAVQKNRKTRAKRGTRRAHDKLMPPTLSEDATTGIRHRRHHINEEGFYRGEQVIHTPTADDEAPEEEEA